jgi:hypothetical protein
MDFPFLFAQQVPVNLLLVKNTTMHGVFWGSYMQHDYRQLAGGMREVLGWLGEGKLQLEVSHRSVETLCSVGQTWVWL